MKFLRCGLLAPRLKPKDLEALVPRSAIVRGSKAWNDSMPGAEGFSEASIHRNALQSDKLTSYGLFGRYINN